MCIILLDCGTVSSCKGTIQRSVRVNVSLNLNSESSISAVSVIAILYMSISSVMRSAATAARVDAPRFPVAILSGGRKIAVSGVSFGSASAVPVHSISCEGVVKNEYTSEFAKTCPVTTRNV